MRAFEQIRVDIGINAQPVILVGVGGGLAYDKLVPLIMLMKMSH